MLLRRTLLACLGLWVGLGIVLAPARPMPGMAMGSAPTAAPTTANNEPTTVLEHAGHGGPHQKAAGHHRATPAKTSSPEQPPAEPEPSGHDHLARCVLCVVGAGTLTPVFAVKRLSSQVPIIDLSVRHELERRRFRHFRSRAPPTVAS